MLNVTRSAPVSSFQDIWTPCAESGKHLDKSLNKFLIALRCGFVKKFVAVICDRTIARPIIKIASSAIKGHEPDLLSQLRSRSSDVNCYD